MIFYLVKTIFCLSLILLFYKCILEKEKVHHFNRAYLMLGLILSLIIPMLPTNLFVENTFLLASSFESTPLNAVNETVLSPQESIFPKEYIVFTAYVLISLILLIRSIHNILSILQKKKNSKTLEFRGAKLILVAEKIPPQTFMKSIYINSEDYTKGKIDPRILEHEYSHAKQWHSIDIIIIELMRCVFWINPVFKYYKHAIQLNHEFIADQAVIDSKHDVTKYQKLLFNFINTQNNNPLTSNVNFQFTQKRFNMMIKNSSTKRKMLCILGSFMLSILLTITLGQSVNAQKLSQVQDFDKDAYFENTIVSYYGKDGKNYVAKYNSLPQKIKAMIPPPPPSPPSAPVKEGLKIDESYWDNLKPLPKGTQVFLEQNGSVIIGEKISIEEDSELPPPPPPPAPPTIEEFMKMVDDHTTFYINGELGKREVAEKIIRSNSMQSITFDDRYNPLKKVFLVVD